MKWTRAMPALVLGLGLSIPAAAPGAGGPVTPVQSTFLSAPGSPYRYGAFGAGRNTVVERLQDGRRAMVRLRLSGQYGIPGVGYSGTMTGLAANGRTLILAEIPGPRTPRATRLIVLDTPRLTVRFRLSLPGWSTVDAISPDGHWLYLIQYSARNLASYAVRAYDLRTRHLLAAPIVDPKDREEAMTGIAITRVMSAGERWAYTLYMRPSGVPFLHALDTVGRRAVCVDLPSLSNVDLSITLMKLGPEGSALRIETPGAPTTLVNTRGFAVTTAPWPPVRVAAARITPALGASAPAARRRAARGTPWTLVAFALLAIAVVALAGARRARMGRRPGPVRVAGAVALSDPDGRPVYRVEGEPAEEKLHSL